MTYIISKNPFSGKEYKEKKNKSETGKIQKFLRENNSDKVVVIQGLGYVGSVMSLVCANSNKKNYAVIGVDLATPEALWKIKSLNEGIFPIEAEDFKLQKVLNKVKKKGNFLATFDDFAYKKADIILVDIGFDLEIKFSNGGKSLNYELNIKDFLNALQPIADNCKEDVTILVETTLPPGMTQKAIMPFFKKALKKRGLSDENFKLGHSPERVMPGPEYLDSIQNFYRVYAGVDEASANEIEKFLKSIISTKDYPLTRVSDTNSSEMLKVLENSYRSMNIAFIEEWARFSEEAGTNLFEVIEAIKLRPTHNNMMYPGLGVGGYCLTKDSFIAGWSRKNFFNSNLPLSLSEKSTLINNRMPEKAFNFLKSSIAEGISNKSILLLGVSYRGDIGDTRQTPVGLFYELCKKSKNDVLLHDPFVSYWEEKKLKINQNLGEVLTPNVDIVVITAAHSFYSSKKLINHLVIVKPKVIFDTVGILSKSNIKSLERISKVLVLGRGDLQ
tara:strand:+ start:37970 stop:39472 length:1503 start_codon:yes stop_codon:yes gene_type:complete